METSQAKEYLPVVMLAVLATAFVGGMLALSALLGVRGKRNRAKDTAYECGMVPVGEGTTRFSVKFYLVAMLFIVFDIETVFLIPWAAIYFGGGAQPGATQMGSMGFLLVEMLVFLVILFVGYLYVWKRGAFQWD